MNIELYSTSLINALEALNDRALEAYYNANIWALRGN
jgi:hypothetical protein